MPRAALLRAFLVTAGLGSQKALSTQAVPLSRGPAAAGGEAQPAYTRRERSSEEEAPPEEVAVAPRGSAGEALALCHPAIVQESCAAEGLAAVGPASLGRVLRSSDEAAASLLEALRLPREDGGASVLSCGDLCGSVLEYYRRSGVALPESSDRGCYTLGGATRCDVDLSAPALESLAEAFVGPVAERLAAEEGTGSDLADDEQHAQLAVEADGSSTPLLQTSTTAELVERLANFFHIFPPSEQGVVLSSPHPLEEEEEEEEEQATDSLLAAAGPAVSILTPSGVQVSAAEKTAIANAHVLAKVFAQKVVSQMQAGRTSSFERKWFGQLSSQARGVLLRNMTMVKNILDASPHFVYPANSQVKSVCGTTLLAYVTLNAKTCSTAKEAYTLRCTSDPQHRNFIYLCKYWYDKFRVTSQALTMLHEAAHLTGVNKDWGNYRKDSLALPQAKKLVNAPSYEFFAADVAQTALGCLDKDETCTGLRGRCDSDQAVKAKCKATCGLCPGTPSARRHAGR